MSIINDNFPSFKVGCEKESLRYELILLFTAHELHDLDNSSAVVDVSSFFGSLGGIPMN